MNVSLLRGLVCLLAGASVAVLASCSDGDDSPTPTPSAPSPSATPTAQATPSAPAGSGLFVYMLPPQRGRPEGPVTLAVFDMPTGRERASASFSSERPSTAAIWRDGVAVAFPHRVEISGFDLQTPHTLFEAPPDSSSIADLAVSPDGTKLALTVEPQACSRPDCTFYSSQLYVLELTSGRELLKLDWPDPKVHGFDGALYQLHWRDDGQGVWVAGATHSERPGTKATVMLDGTLRIEPLEGFVSIAPNGRIAAHGPGSLGCMFISGHRLAILDLDSGGDLFAIEDDAFAFTPWEWSPRGDEFVFAVRRYVQSSSNDCAWTQSPAEWRVATLDGAPARTVTEAQLLQLRLDWYGSKHVTAGCERPENPMLGRYADLAPQCVTALPDGAIRVGGVDVGRTGTVQIIGFTD